VDIAPLIPEITAIIYKMWFMKQLVPWNTMLLYWFAVNQLVKKLRTFVNYKILLTHSQQPDAGL
jgi:hypothetical protein